MLIQITTYDIGRTMYTILESFTAREWSIIIWMGLFIIFQMRRSSFRSSLLQIVKLLCNKKILIPLIICYFYMFGFACILYQYGMMHTFLLKDLLFWCILVPIPSMVGYINGKKTDFLNFAIKNGTLVSLILAVQSYCTFSFVVEFISFPILCILAAFSALSQIENNKYGSVSKVIDKLLFAVGFVVMTYSLYKALIDIDALISNHFIQSFVFNEALYLAFTPLLYVYCVLAAYEYWFVALKFRSSTDNYKSRCVFFIKKCGLNLSKIRYISNHLHVYVPQTEEQLIVDYLECNKKYHSNNAK